MTKRGETEFTCDISIILAVIPKFHLVIPNGERDLKEMAGW